MKKFFVLILCLFFAIGTAFSQNADNPVSQMDEAVRNLARDIHGKLVERRAQKISIGQFVFLDSIPPFSAYWVNQLIGELTNTPGRTYSILSGAASDAEWTVVGEIVQAANIIRVYSRLVRVSDRSIEASFYSSFQRDEYINDMISLGSSSGGGTAPPAGGRDSREPDSWDNPVTYVLGTSQGTPAMNRAITEGDEDFFLFVPDRDGRLTAETTGSIDTYMHLFNYDNGDELATNDDGGQGTNARIVYNVQAGTRYLAMVRGYGPSTNGAYGFRAFISVREGATNWDNPLSYEIGSDENNIVTVNRTIQQGDSDYFLLVPARDGRIIIETTGRIDTYLELYDSDRDLLEENDDGGQNYNARIRFDVSAGNRYIAMVRGYSASVSGSFGFRAYFPGQGLLSPDEFEPDNEPSQARVVEIGTPQQHTFHTGNDVDWIRFQVTQAGRYRIQTRGVNSNRLDTYIELYDGNLNIIAEDDDSGDSLSSRLSLNLNSGVYYLKVWCLDEEPDQGYTINITSESPSPR